MVRSHAGRQKRVVNYSSFHAGGGPTLRMKLELYEKEELIMSTIRPRPFLILLAAVVATVTPISTPTAVAEPGGDWGCYVTIPTPDCIGHPVKPGKPVIPGPASTSPRRRGPVSRQSPRTGVGAALNDKLHSDNITSAIT